MEEAILCTQGNAVGVFLISEASQNFGNPSSFLSIYLSIYLLLPVSIFIKNGDCLFVYLISSHLIFSSVMLCYVFSVDRAIIQQLFSWVQPAW